MSFRTGDVYLLLCETCGDRFRSTAPRVNCPACTQSPFLPEGVTFVPLGDPAAMHDAIADGLGEVQP